MREPISPATSSSGTTGPGSTPDSATSLPKKYSTSGQKASEWRRNRQFNRSEIFGADHFGERHLRQVLGVYADHYSARRPHRALRLRPPRPTSPVPQSVHGRIRRRPILGGLINEYETAA